MGNRSGREAQRGTELKTWVFGLKALGLDAGGSTAAEWVEVLKGPLERAAGRGDRGLAKRLLEAGARSGDALHAAVRGGHGEVVNDLLESGASINAHDNKYGETPLHVAAKEGKTEMVQLLILKGAEKDAFDNKDSTPLYSAACNGHVPAALAIMAGGADVNIRYGGSKQSVLHVAAEEGHVVILRAAIEHGADVNAADIYQSSALHLAAERNKFEAINVLSEAGANIEARDRSGWTPLHYATVNSSVEALTGLLKHSAHVNAQDIFLQTPMHTATTEAKSPRAADVVDALLRSGADETIVDENGKTAANVLAEDGRGEDSLPEGIERMFKLLENAPVDRAWRRRGYLVLCRAHPDRTQHTRDKSSGEHADIPRTPHSTNTLRRPEPSRSEEGVEGTAVDGGLGTDWAGVVAKVLGLQEEGIFRMIVGYL